MALDDADAAARLRLEGQARAVVDDIRCPPDPQAPQTPQAPWRRTRVPGAGATWPRVRASLCECYGRLLMPRLRPARLRPARL